MCSLIHEQCPPPDRAHHRLLLRDSEIPLGIVVVGCKIFEMNFLVACERNETEVNPEHCCQEATSGQRRDLRATAANAMSFQHSPEPGETAGAVQVGSIVPASRTEGRTDLAMTRIAAKNAANSSSQAPGSGPAADLETNKMAHLFSQRASSRGWCTRYTLRAASDGRGGGLTIAHSRAGDDGRTKVHQRPTRNGVARAAPPS